MRIVLRTCSNRVFAIVAMALAFCAISSAAAITGGFGTTGAGVLTFANGTNTIHFIDWCPTDPTSPVTGSPTCGTLNNGLGNLFAQGGTGTFSSLVAPTPGTIKDMVDQNCCAPFTFFPVGVPVSISNFLTISTLPQYNIRAEFLVPETCVPSGNTVCIGPFILTQAGNNVSVTATVNGTVLDTSNALTPAGFTYIISGQFTNNTIGAVAAAAQTTSGIFSNTWSGTFATSAIPEPGTIYLALGAILGGLGISRRLRKAR